jgi:hypothetical protein
VEDEKTMKKVLFWLSILVLGASTTLAVALAAGGPYAEQTAPAVQNRSDREEPSGAGASKNAEAVATAFGMQPEEVLDLHAQGVGFGALVKLLALAKVKGTTPSALLTAVPVVNGEREFNFGDQFKALSGQQRSELEKLGIKNLGQLKTKEKR